jgi:hypothetical protein
VAEQLKPMERITRALNRPGLSDGKLATTIKLGELQEFVAALDEVDGRGPDRADQWMKAALAFELSAMRVEYVIRLLVAAGHVTQQKVDEAFHLARDFTRADGVAPTPAPQRHSSGAWECPMTGFPCPNNCERPCGVEGRKP